MITSSLFLPRTTLPARRSKGNAPLLIRVTVPRLTECQVSISVSQKCCKTRLDPRIPGFVVESYAGRSLWFTFFILQIKIVRLFLLDK